MNSKLLALVTAVVAAAGGGSKSSVQNDPRWEEAVSVGNTEGRVFEHQVGRLISFKTPLLVASGSKFPATLAILGTVEDGYVDLDEPVSTYLEFWTKNGSDPRSRVTLRSLLSFTSGFYDSGVAGSQPCMTKASYDFVKCAQQIYEHAPFAFEPRTVFDYNSYHLQLAGAVACVASNMTIAQLIDENLVKRLSLNLARYFPKNNPMLAASLIINGDDYERILRKYLAYEFLSKELIDQIEIDYTDPLKGVNASNSTMDLAKTIGHYGFGHWIECWNNGNDTLTPACKAQHIHSDPGLFG
eukprot:jgi/Bigna1/66070/fgenesh1_pg.1_\